MFHYPGRYPRSVSATENQMFIESGMNLIKVVVRCITFTAMRNKMHKKHSFFPSSFASKTNFSHSMYEGRL